MCLGQGALDSNGRLRLDLRFGNTGRALVVHFSDTVYCIPFAWMEDIDRGS